MSTRLIDLLIAVAEDDDRLVSFLADPEPEMQAARLSEEEKEAVRSRDVGAIEDLTGGASLSSWTSACIMASPHIQEEVRSRAARKPKPKPRARPRPKSKSKPRRPPAPSGRKRRTAQGKTRRPASPRGRRAPGGRRGR
jgi:hypothetical protein